MTCAREVVCIYCICMVETLYNGVLLKGISFQFCVQWYHVGNLQSAMAVVLHYEINTHRISATPPKSQLFNHHQHTTDSLYSQQLEWQGAQ